MYHHVREFKEKYFSIAYLSSSYFAVEHANMVLLFGKRNKQTRQ
jgi:hypothetical protein